MNSIIQWKIYCNTEQQEICGYLDEKKGPPVTCFNNHAHTINKSKTKQIEKIYKNHTREIVHWKIYCDTEKQYTYGYTDLLTPPTTCFNNHTHVVSTHPIPIEKIYNNNTRIQEEWTETGGHLQLDTHTFDIPAGTTGDITYYNASYPHPINMVSTSLCPKENNLGDYVTADVGHHTTIGVLTESIGFGITGGITGFGVSPTVLDYLEIGYLVTITNGVTASEMGRCVMIDKINKKISTEFPTNANYLPGSYIQQTVEMIRKIEFTHPQIIIIGGDKIGSSYVPPNIIGRIKYTNNNGQAKKFTFYNEYLY
jgi:hypothetical protein